MKLYLVRHGEALPKSTDPERGLSGAGKQDVARVAKILATGGVKVRRLWHSGKKRAEETALLFQNCLVSGGEFGRTDGIAPLDPVDTAAVEIDGWEDDTMLVGHLPFMEKLAAQLLMGTETPGLVAFQAGTAACLEKGQNGVWSVRFVVPPDLVATGNP